MKRWWIGFLLALGACIPLLANRSSGNWLLTDSDTAFLLLKLKERHNPWSWFAGDWPLANHFYRPISTLVFEFDQWLHPNNGTGFGLTNALICCLCTLALFWLVTELRQNWIYGALSAWLFTSWTVVNDLGLVAILGWALTAVCVIALFVRPNQWKSLLVAYLAGGYVLYELSGVAGVFNTRQIGADTLHWIPGRTATSMSVFALIALASFVRFERLGAARRAAPAPGPLDPPATRSAKNPTSQGPKSGESWFWYAVSLVATALALGAYEQAVMIPVLVFILAFALNRDGLQVRWWVQTGFWGLLVAYIVLRTQLIPITPSGYQKQQFRTGGGALLSFSDYVAAPLVAIPSLIDKAMMSWELLFFDVGPLLIVKSVTGNVLVWFTQRKVWLWPLTGLLLSLFCFAPMAFLHQFGHYHYLPMALRTIGVVALAEGFVRLLASAVSLPTIQAPQRSDRAPGSLPHL